MVSASPLVCGFACSVGTDSSASACIHVRLLPDARVSDWMRESMIEGGDRDKKALRREAGRITTPARLEVQKARFVSAPSRRDLTQLFSALKGKFER